MPPKRPQASSPTNSRAASASEDTFDKPFDPAEMQRRVAAAVANRRAQQQNQGGCCGGGCGPTAPASKKAENDADSSEPEFDDEDEAPPARRKQASPAPPSPPVKKMKKNADGEIVEDEEAEEDDPVPSKTHYGIIIGLAIFFVSLPLGEPVIDWIQVAVFATLNAVWIGYFHRAVILHIVVFFMLNLLAVQYPIFAQHIPYLLENVDPVMAGAVVGGNVALCGAFWLLYARKRPRKEQGDVWDIFLCALLLANGVAGVATGVIPMAVIYRAFKTIVGLLTNFSVG